MRGENENENENEDEGGEGGLRWHFWRGRVSGSVRMMVRKFISFLLLGALPGVILAQPISITRADERLEDLVTLQRELLLRASVAQVQEDVERIRPRLQNLVFDWEAYLRDYPEKTEGLIGYSMLLGNPLLDERHRAKALLLKANMLDANLPIVKNQLGKYLAEEGLPLQALPYFVAAADLVPDEPLYHYQIGQLLGGARQAFLESPEWSVEAIDKAMQDALAEAVRLDPESISYAYRYAESFYDLENPPWDDAMAAWRELEQRSESPVEQQMMRLHQANVLLFQGELDTVETLLADSWDEVLEGQRDRLLERLERLRNPLPEPSESESELAQAEIASAPKFVVPEFTPGAAVEYSSLSATAMAEIEEGTTINDVVGDHIDQTEESAE